jgi:hypothetical protein
MTRRLNTFVEKQIKWSLPRQLAGYPIRKALSPGIIVTPLSVIEPKKEEALQPPLNQLNIKTCHFNKQWIKKRGSLFISFVIQMQAVFG